MAKALAVLMLAGLGVVGVDQAQAREKCGLLGPKLIEMTDRACEHMQLRHDVIFDMDFAAKTWHETASHADFMAAWDEVRGELASFKADREDWKQALKDNPSHPAARDSDYTLLWDIWQESFNSVLKYIDFKVSKDFRRVDIVRHEWASKSECNAMRGFAFRFTDTCFLPDWRSPAHLAVEADRRAQAAADEAAWLAGGERRKLRY